MGRIQGGLVGSRIVERLNGSRCEGRGNSKVTSGGVSLV